MKIRSRARLPFPPRRLDPAVVVLGLVPRIGRGTAPVPLLGTGARATLANRFNDMSRYFATGAKAWAAVRVSASTGHSRGPDARAWRRPPGRPSRGGPRDGYSPRFSVLASVFSVLNAPRVRTGTMGPAPVLMRARSAFNTEKSEADTENRGGGLKDRISGFVRSGAGTVRFAMRSRTFSRSGARGSTPPNDKVPHLCSPCDISALPHNPDARRIASRNISRPRRPDSKDSALTIATRNPPGGMA